MSTEAKLPSRKGRPNYPMEFKRCLERQACEAGVSVSKLALEHGVNANMLFKWRRHYRAGLFDKTDASSALVPVAVIGAAPDLPPAKAVLAPADAALGAGIEIAFADCTVRIDRQTDMAMLRAVLALLRQ